MACAGRADLVHGLRTEGFVCVNALCVAIVMVIVVVVVVLYLCECSIIRVSVAGTG